MMTYTFTLEVGFNYEPTRTDVSNLAKYISRRTTATVVSKVAYETSNTTDTTDYWTVTLTFTCTRVQAARALFAPRFKDTMGACLYVYIEEFMSSYFISNLGFDDKGENPYFLHALWPTNASIPTNVSERRAS